jgi:hypothetical protein
MMAMTTAVVLLLACGDEPSGEGAGPDAEVTEPKDSGDASLDSSAPPTETDDADSGDASVDMAEPPTETDAEDPTETRPACRPEVVCASEDPSDADRVDTDVDPMGIGGGILTALGIGGVIGGAALLGVGRNEISGNPETEVIVDYRIPGGVTLGVGAAALVTGTVLLVLDRRRKQGQVTFTPGFGARSVRIGVGGTF